MGRAYLCRSEASSSGFLVRPAYREVNRSVIYPGDFEPKASVEVRVESDEREE